MNHSTNIDQLTIRFATPQDAAELSELVGELAEYEKLGDSNHCTPESIRQELTADNGVLQAVVGSYQDTVVGMATFFTTYSTFAAKRGLYLEDIYVRPQHRHRGFGRSLLEFVAKYAVANNFGRMEWSTLLWNIDAIEFYEALGARPNDAWTAYRLTGDSLARLAGHHHADD